MAKKLLFIWKIKRQKKKSLFKLRKKKVLFVKLKSLNKYINSYEWSISIHWATSTPTDFVPFFFSLPSSTPAIWYCLLAVIKILPLPLLGLMMTIITDNIDDDYDRKNKSTIKQFSKLFIPTSLLFINIFLLLNWKSNNNNNNHRYI